MALTVIIFTLSVFLIIVAVFYTDGQDADIKYDRLQLVRNTSAPEEKKKPILRDVSFEEIKAHIDRKRQERIRSRQVAETKSGRKLSPLEVQLRTAGISMSASAFTGCKLLIGTVFALMAGILGLKLNKGAGLALLCSLGGMLGGWIIPGRMLLSKLNKQQETYRDALPDIMDLLVVSVEAGLGFDAALLRLYQKDKSPLMEELMRAVRDVQHGMSKREAYGNMSARCNVKELTSFLNALVQAEQLGISIKTVLRTQSENLREDRRRRAEEKALKAPVTMLLPLVLFIFPVIFIILLGPAVLNILEVFKG